MKKLLFFSFSLILCSHFPCTRSAKLDKQELKVMKEIWGKLGLARKKEWDFDKGPCSEDGNWPSSVYCDCSFERNTTCHVTQIGITSQNISTAIPSEFTKLRYLQLLDLSHSYLRGTIPSEWATMRLRKLSLVGNRLSGLFPIALTRMTTLLDLHIQGCSFEGPLPSSISALTKLKDLRISDLKGEASTFPSLEKMLGLNILVLRNCLIHGTIPNYFGNMTHLKTLDLSFNNLTGDIPASLSLLETDYMYLTKNNLTGHIPGWILSSTKVVDVSYNNFTWDASGPNTCEQGKINTVESYSASTNNQKNIHPCLRKDFPCTKPDALKIHSLHINCGGKEVYINNTFQYEADTEGKGASLYYFGGNWAFSSTGHFLDVNYDSLAYILSNTSNLHNISPSDTELYTTARTAAISLTYYGLCLMNGNYRVRLHFAEIVFTQDHSSNTLGRRVFDVYVQGELKVKDFDIVKEAGGTGRAVIKNYIVNVKNNTLKIQLYWAGKGTTEVPVRGSYGPIISAISVDPILHPRFDILC